MSKVRVHELAKEFGLENKEVIQRLNAADIAAKTHSSSVDVDSARKVLGGAGEAKPKKKKRAGMMIVRKKTAVAETPVEATPPEPAEAPVAEAPVVEAAAPVEEAAVEAAAPVEAPVVEAAAPVEAPVVEAAATPVEVPVAEPVAAPVEAPVEKPAEPVAAPVEAAPVEAAATPAKPAETEKPKEAATPEASAPAASTEGAAPAAPAVKAPIRGPKGGARVVRMIDKEKLMERLPARRGGGGGRPGGGRPGGPGGGRPGGPGGGRPGGPGGPGGPGRGAPRFGQVTELKVVSDPFGGGREMVQVGRERKGPGGPGKGAPQKRRGPGGGKPNQGPNKRNMMNMRERSFQPSRLRRKKGKKHAQVEVERGLPTHIKESKRVVKMKENIIITDLAKQMNVKAAEIIRKLIPLGMMVTVNQIVDFETAQLVSEEFGYRVESIAFKEEEVFDVVAVDDEDPADLENRPPVVTIMGHVDHGKTSLLDTIRSAKVASGEAGGITQHIGAYSVELKGKGKITFLDTPGHAAFTSMRARGAQATDIVVLVVAADDGCMPQTEEAIQHSQAAGVPIVVAVNKMDLVDANPDRVTQELSQFNIMPEAWGGDTLFVQTSAIKQTGIDELLETILLQAEVLELKANPKRDAQGIVVESRLDKGRGPVATILVQQGTLKKGDFLVVGEQVGKVRAMTDHTGKQLKVAGPSSAVEIIGLEGTPEAGDQFNAVESMENARDVADHRVEQSKAEENVPKPKMGLEELMKRMRNEEVPELRVVLKSDVHGSAEAVKQALVKLSTDEVKVNIIYSGVGGIKESDITLASASKGLVLGFGVRPDGNATRVADKEKVEIRTYNVIYEMVDDVKKAMEGLLAPEEVEKVVGRAEVRELFRISKVGVIGGSRVLDGKAQRSANVRVLRDSREIYAGKVASLKQYKDDTREVDSGQECGIGVEGYNDLKLGDVIEFFTVEQVGRTLD
jgi:translation initiation factor IF-2